jgi:hypothetical protein
VFESCHGINTILPEHLKPYKFTLPHITHIIAAAAAAIIIIIIII